MSTKPAAAHAVLFAIRDALPGGVPDEVRAFGGQLPYRDAPPDVAAKYLREKRTDKPTAVTFEEGSPYRNAFRQGATLVPRMLCLVDPVATGRLGGSAKVPLVRSHRSKQEKKPWKMLDPLQGQIEAEFLRPVYLGESIAPYRVLSSALGVIPFDNEMLTSIAARQKGWPYLAGWLARAEALWKQHGGNRISLSERLNYFHLLDCQIPPKALRVVYAASGTLSAAALIEDERAVVEHKLYWMTAETRAEGRYLCALINSETAREKVAHLQSRGQWGARDFDKVLFTLPIPRFMPKDENHRALAEVAARAEQIAAAVPLKPNTHFIAARRAIREALEADGVVKEIDHLVSKLLGG